MYIEKRISYRYILQRSTGEKVVPTGGEEGIIGCNNISVLSAHVGRGMERGVSYAAELCAVGAGRSC